MAQLRERCAPQRRRRRPLVARRVHGLDGSGLYNRGFRLDGRRPELEGFASNMSPPLMAVHDDAGSCRWDGRAERLLRQRQYSSPRPSLSCFPQPHPTVVFFGGEHRDVSYSYLCICCPAGRDAVEEIMLFLPRKFLTLIQRRVEDRRSTESICPLLARRLCFGVLCLGQWRSNWKQEFQYSYGPAVNCNSQINDREAAEAITHHSAPKDIQP